MPKSISKASISKGSILLNRKIKELFRKKEQKRIRVLD